MIRELKYRAWNRRTNKMESSLEIRMHTLNDLMYDDWNVYMQYIWLKDKDWVEIYEGDILKDTNWKLEAVSFGIYYDWGSYYDNKASFIKISYDLDNCIKDDDIIIWNIYENPNLIEQ